MRQLSHIIGLTTANKFGIHTYVINDICHYKGTSTSLNIGSMYRQANDDLVLFQDLSEHQAEILDSAFEPFEFKKDTHIFEQGQTANYLYILTSGRVIIRYKPYDGPQISVATIQPGGVFGWSTALGRSLYSSGALVLENSQGFRISKSRLCELMDVNPETRAILIKKFAGMVNNPSDPAHAEILKILSHSLNHIE